MVDVPRIATNVRKSESGIWFGDARSDVSYPSEGHTICLQLEDRSFWFRHRNRAILELLKLLPPPGPLLDIGGGNGFVSRAVEQAGMDVALLEPGVEGAQNARDRGLATVICSTLEDLDIRPGSVGGAGLFDVLEHVADETGFLRQVRHSLRPGGRVYLTVPARQLLWSDEDTAAGHFRRYSPRSLAAALRGAGFMVELLTSIFWMLPAPILLLRALPGWLGIHRKGLAHARAEHLTNAGPLRTALEWLQSAELVAIRSRRTVLFGASLLAGAVKA
jgi:SAM-dependent methyltransferase